MIQFLSQMIADFSTVIKAAIAAAASVYVAAVWWKTKALVPTVTAVVMAGVVVWATANVDVLRDQVGQDTNDWIQSSDGG
ncbi:hypothetical protein BH24ACT15_BH24ACT15_15760 [soil metagenome]